MLIPDVNVILNASVDGSPHHAVAARWFEAVQAGTEPLAIPGFILAAVVRISTNPRILDTPFDSEQAFAVCEAWRSILQFRTLEPDPAHWQTFREVVSTSGVTGPSVTDAYIASFAIHHNATLVTFDRGFSRFPGLRWLHPEP